MNCTVWFTCFPNPAPLGGQLSQAMKKPLRIFAIVVAIILVVAFACAEYPEAAIVGRIQGVDLGSEIMLTIPTEPAWDMDDINDIMEVLNQLSK